MKVYLIARVSTDEQVDALPAQVYRLEDFARRQNYEDYKLLQFIESAHAVKRAEFRAFLEEVVSSKENVIFVFDKIDRYSRFRNSDEDRIMQKLYRSGKAEIHFPSDNLINHKDSPATDLLRLGLGIIVAQYYSDSIADNVKRRFEQKLRDGEWIGKAPFGYKNVTCLMVRSGLKSMD